MASVLTPSYLQDFETDLQYRAVSAWDRTIRQMWWPRLMTVVPVTGAVKYIEWMLETARIQPLGPHGSQMAYDPLVAISYALRHDHFGNGLKLYRDEIEDDKIDRAAKWATDTGKIAAYWPQRVLVQMLQTGKSTTVTDLQGVQRLNLAYDGKPFFAVDHPSNPKDSSVGTFSNLHAGTTFTAENLARVVAYIESIQHAGGAPMGSGRILTMFPTNYRYRGSQALTAEWFTDVLSPNASAQNVFKTAYQFEPPVFAAELNNEPSTWYVGIPADEDAFDAPFAYVEREAFSINMYSPMTVAELGRTNEFEWQNRGRNGAAYGHPYLWHRVEAAGVQESLLSSIVL